MKTKTYGPYWNPKTELAERWQIEGMQLYKFQRTLQHAFANSRLWKGKLDEAGVRPNDIKTPEDVRRVPLLTKKEFLDSQEREPLFGDLLAASSELAINYHQTSGTEG